MPESRPGCRDRCGVQASAMQLHCRAPFRHPIGDLGLRVPHAVGAPAWLPALPATPLPATYSRTLGTQNLVVQV